MSVRLGPKDLTILKSERAKNEARSSARCEIPRFARDDKAIWGGAS